eukprot:Clim_evm16s233 gene=Clim_evmTU16s233
MGCNQSVPKAAKFLNASGFEPGKFSSATVQERYPSKLVVDEAKHPPKPKKGEEQENQIQDKPLPIHDEGGKTVGFWSGYGTWNGKDRTTIYDEHKNPMGYTFTTHGPDEAVPGNKKQKHVICMTTPMYSGQDVYDTIEGVLVYLWCALERIPQKSTMIVHMEANGGGQDTDKVTLEQMKSFKPKYLIKLGVDIGVAILDYLKTSKEGGRHEIQVAPGVNPFLMFLIMIAAEKIKTEIEGFDPLAEGIGTALCLLPCLILS